MMDTKPETDITVCEARSYARCIQMGVLAANDHAGTVLHHAWPSLLLGLVVPFPGMIFYTGQVNRLLREWQQQGTMPRLGARESLSEDFDSAVRVLAREALMTVVALVVIGLTWAAGAFLPHGVWMGLGTFILLTLLLMPTVMAMMDMSCSTRPLARCLAGTRTGFRHYSSLFAFQLLLFMLTLLIIVPGTIPAFLSGMITGIEYRATQAGDYVAMPALWPLTLTAAYIMANFFAIVAITIREFCHMLFWGSIQAREAEPKEN